MPELSVIMGVYNCPSKEMMNRAIDSILDQTYSDFEFLICDDGSTNETLKWLREKSLEDSRIVIIENEKNSGLAAALNQCLKRAKSSLIARQDIDDYSAKTRFRIQMDFLSGHKNVAFVGTNCFVYDKNGLYGEWHRPEYPSKQDFLFNSPFIHGTTMFRREVFEKCGGYRLIGKCRKYEDYEFFMKAYANGFQGANIDQLLYTFYSEEKKNLVSSAMRIDEYHVRKEGFKALGMMPKAFPYVLKPVILMFAPNKILNWMKDWKKNSLMHKYSLSLKMYKIIVNRNSYIKFNYERFVNTNRKLHSRFPLVSWAYLIKLNFKSIFLRRSQREQENAKGLKKSESAVFSPVNDLVRQLEVHDIISFDIFDTLIFRPFAVPTDLFYIVGEKLNYPDFKTIRTEAEKTVRRNHGGESIKLKDIYDFISERTGIDSEIGQEIEMQTELALCTANPYMKAVYEALKKKNKRIIIVSDMYLSSEFIAQILEKNGFTGYERLYISCEKKCGKHNGGLYDVIKDELGTSDIIHIGDNYGSDVRNAKKHGLFAIEYKNVNSEGNIYRPKNMSPIIGSAYSGIVNRRLYRGDISYSPAYEYGFKYGGLLILGFCEYIHKIADERAADKILFFSRDGYIVKEIYGKLFPDEKTEYVYWSRNAATKLGADHFRDIFIKRFITQKINHGISLYDVFHTIGISDLDFPFSLNDELTSKNAPLAEKFVLDHWDRLMRCYSDMDKATRQYFVEILKNCENIITVDCGWAGSGNIILEYLVNEKWGLNCRFTGVLAGSNSYNQHDSDFSETFLLDGKMAVYCFSSSLNRDKFLFHQPSANHNIYFEMLFSAPEPSFREFFLTKSGKTDFIFDNAVENELYIREIQKGERDFVLEYTKSFKDHPFMRNISGSDAYTPFMEAMKHSKKYIQKVFAECVFDETTNGRKVRIQ